MDDHTFLQAFEHAQLPQFPHESHIRMAWLYLRLDGLDEGTRKICEGLRHFAETHGAANKYHETITLFWVKLVHHTIALSPDIDDFQTFVERHPHLLDGKLMTRHYSAEILWSSQARSTWVEPDLHPMPMLQ